MALNYNLHFISKARGCEKDFKVLIYNYHCFIVFFQENIPYYVYVYNTVIIKIV